MIGFFHEYDEYGCFSNWYPAQFEYAGMHYAHVEQYMMFQKVLVFGKTDLASKIMEASDPAVCKNIAKQPFPEFDSALWDKVSYTIVKRGVRAKFLQNPDLLDTLLGTGNELLAECSPYDKKWGIGIDINDPAHTDTSKWKGRNLLGRALMEVREELRLEKKMTNDALEYIDATSLDPIPEWEMTAGELRMIPQYYDAIHAYADKIKNHKERIAFYYANTLQEHEQLIGLSRIGVDENEFGFFEMKQDIYDIARRLKWGK